ncbi:MAG: hypothetical protein IM584_01500 [Chitinophagaceae bacterium]|nr:hypothetical protein [Chitinophagaceae bacterium]MCA6453208.1 hypothetical protein [Chitinophagaceae bacterium]MCA6454788.1 hypothetical protein [Chitinophagaceae bacterium]MCA6459419.1 hypothetical protein [Chitinophagaceae bacterium]MCA6464777.1 hypothetical protein [Chitinophagaceae bacterium]
MTSIVNKNGETIAYLYQNMILDLTREKVIGLILGNCVFGKQTGPAGKFFNDTFRKKNGKIIAKLGDDVSATFKKSPKDAQLSLQAWQILSKVDNHVCLWIEEKKSWTKQGFIEYLKADKDLVEEE